MGVGATITLAILASILFPIVCFIIGYGCYRWYTSAEEKRNEEKENRRKAQITEEKRLTKLHAQLEAKYDFVRVKEGVDIGYCVFLFGSYYYKTKTPDFCTYQWNIYDTTIIIKTNKNLEVIDKKILER